jgi:hypothetical protein
MIGKLKKNTLFQNEGGFLLKNFWEIFIFMNYGI